MLRNSILALLLLFTVCSQAEAANRFGVCTVTCTWDTSSTAMWSTTSGGGTGASVPGSADIVIFDAATCVGGVTCTITIAAATNPTLQSITWGACTASTTGCIIDNSANNNMTFTGSGGFNGSGTGTRTWTGGSGTYTLSTSQSTWTIATSTNLSNPTTAFSSATVTLSFVSTSSTPQFLPGTLTYGTVNLNGNKGINLGNVAFTVGTLNVTGPNSLKFPQGVTTTITNAFNWTGTSAAPILIANSNPGNGVGSITTGSGTTNTAAWAIFEHITFIPVGGSTLTATNSLDLGLNTGTGFTITPPSSGGGKIIGG